MSLGRPDAGLIKDMVTDSEIPAQFGGSLEGFRKEWCLGGELAVGPARVATGLAALSRLWPEEVNRLVANPSRGLHPAVCAVDVGLLLADCQPCAGFAEVLGRLRHDRRSAYSELVVVASLLRLGFSVHFGAALEGRVLDACCELAGARVYFEVVAPEQSDANQLSREAIDRFTTEIRRTVTKCRLEIEVFVVPDAASARLVCDAVSAAVSGEWVEVEDVARFRRIDAGQPLPNPFDGDGPSIVIGGDRDVQSDNSGVIIRWDVSDTRAKRVFNDEYHHFSARVANVLVVDVCAVSDGMKVWPVEMGKLLQPARNRKVGAVLFFEQGMLGTPEAIRRRWRVLVNPHASVPIPEPILTGFEGLDESTAYGLKRYERLSA